VVWTADAHRELIYISGNAVKVLGFTAEELLGTGWHLWLDRIHPEDAAAVNEAYQNLFSQRRKHSMWNTASAGRTGNGFGCMTGR
jgi:PAS domain S-box-containing protein